MKELIKDYEYIGIIIEGLSTGSDGKYLVYIRELMSSVDVYKPIWVKNEVIGNRFSRWLDLTAKDIKSSGAYFPLHKDMLVNVRFRGNTLESGYISNIISYLPLIDKASSRDSFYLINKTINNSWIYQDDNRNLTHIMHHDGKSNIVLDDDSITLQTGGKLKTNGFEVSNTGTRMEFGNAAIYLDAKGITFKIGDTSFNMTESGIVLKSQGSITCESEKALKFKSKDLNLSSTNELTLYSSVLRLTGAQQTSINASTLALNSTLLTDIQSTVQVNVGGMIKTKISSPMIDINSLTNINLTSPVLTLSGQTTNISGSILNLSGGSIAMDGIISHGLGIATSINSSMTTMNTTLDLSTDLANMALVSSLGNTDPVSRVSSSVMIQSLPGAARPVGELLAPQIVSAKVGNSIKEKITYITSSNNSYNTIVTDQFTDLRNTHDIHK